MRYKKIKFIEKRKVIRHLEQLSKKLKESGSSDQQALKDEKVTWQNKLTYIDNYPPNWKYISLFAKMDDSAKEAEGEKLR